MSSSPPPPSFLPVRLTRESPLKSQLGCTALLVAVLLGVAGLCYFAGSNPTEEDRWVAWVVGGAFGFFGLLLLWSFIRQLGSVGLRGTIVELSTEPLQPGQTASICLIQPGPAKLKSLRANLVRLEERAATVWDAASKRSVTRRQETVISTENLINAGHLNVATGDHWHEIREFDLPVNAPVAGTADAETTRWKIEVWGTGYLLASFMHPFPVDVFHGERPEEDDIDDEDDTMNDASD